MSPSTTAYKDRKVIHFQDVKNFNHDGVRETTIQLGSHSGTHVDAPSHFLKDGKTIDELSLDRLVGNCVVLDMTNCAERITHDCFMKYDHLIKEGDIILLRTTNSDLTVTDKFNPHFVYLEESGASYLVKKKITVVGIDYLGIERSQPGHPTHETLMNADIIIVEGLRLQHVKQGCYTFICLPIYTIGVEAAPARAILLEK